MERIPMTAEGLQRLEGELKVLKSVERPAIIKAIATAREHGDLSENAEYTSAREKQGFIEGRIAELEDIISRTEVIDFSKLTGKIIKFGATVRLADEDTDEKVKYQIVGPYEADLAQGRISITSPIGCSIRHCSFIRPRRRFSLRSSLAGSASMAISASDLGSMPPASSARHEGRAAGLRCREPPTASRSCPSSTRW